MSEGKMLAVKDLSFIYEGKWLLHNLSFSLKKGEVATLIGASGSGKTTLFKLITGILQPEFGTIEISGQKLPTGHGNVAYMMQEDLLLPWRTVLDNMTLMAELGKKSLNKKSLQSEALQLLKEIDMPDCAHLFPNQLSGGMKQRVTLARALMQKRPLLLLDEPFSSLDVILREQMYALLRQLQKNHGTTMLLVTHDFRDALSLSDHIYLLAKCCINKEWIITEEMRNDPYASNHILEQMRDSMR